MADKLFHERISDAVYATVERARRDKDGWFVIYVNDETKDVFVRDSAAVPPARSRRYMTIHYLSPDLGIEITYQGAPRKWFVK